MSIAYPIGYPITTPIGFYRGRPNRPRIAHIESCHVSPFSSGLLRERELKAERANGPSRSLQGAES